jgi:hypothetical protein
MRLAVFRVFVGAVLGLAMMAQAKADPVTFIITGTGSGALGAQSFSNTAFTISSTADTAFITNPFSGVFILADQTATVNVSGIGTGAFTSQTSNVSNQNFSRAGISDPSFAILFVNNPGFSTYSLATSIGPLSGPASFNSGANFATTAGNFRLDTVQDATFEARVTTQAVPEPASLTLAGIGVVTLVGYARRRKVLS